VNHKVITIVNGEINNIFEEEKEEIYESFEEETMREPIYDEEYVGADICEVFEEEGKGDPVYDDEYVPDDIHEVFEKEENDESIYNVEYLPVGYAESLEVERSLQTTAKNMVFNVIIHNKNCENVASNYLEEKLKFPMIEHPRPYKLQWKNEDNEVKVSQPCIVSFSIDNNYKENLWCDVIPMDDFHIHLGRPCQYDRRALFNGYAITFTFIKDVIKIKVAPLLLNEFNDGKVESKLLGLSLAEEPFKDKTNLYMPRPIPKPWEDVTIDFSLGLLWTQHLKVSKMVVEDMFSKMAKFISCQKVTVVALRTKKKSLTRGRVSSNPGRMIENDEE